MLATFHIFKHGEDRQFTENYFSAHYDSNTKSNVSKVNSDSRCKCKCHVTAQFDVNVDRHCTAVISHSSVYIQGSCRALQKG